VTPELEAELDRAVAVIRGAGSLALACHVTPDGDALGSLLAMHHLCRANGQPSLASWPRPFVVAPHYRYLPGLDRCTKPDDFPEQPEVMLTFDCGSLARLGELAWPAEAAGDLIVLDHHATNDRYGTINVIDTGAAATAVVVRTLARRLGWQLTRDAAICLYSGLVTDTGRFQYDCTTPDVFALAEELSRFDLPISSMSRQLFEEHRFDYLQLVAAALGRAQLDKERRFVATWVTIEDFERFGCDFEEAEGLIDLVRRTSEATVSCVLKETHDGTRVSLRAVDDTDVGVIALQFGGGGHRAAAGWTDDRPIPEVLEAIRAVLPVRAVL
jgi:phosphoesterase RecJ-like protein